MEALLYPCQPLKSGQANLNVVARPSWMTLVKDGQNRNNTEIVLDDRRVKVSEIAETVRISDKKIRSILHNELGMRKLLNAYQMHMQKRLSQQCDFVWRFITMGEMWVHQYTPETKQQSKQWVEADGSTQKKAKSIASAGKVMASAFWDAKRILLIDYLEKGRTITGRILLQHS